MRTGASISGGLHAGLLIVAIWGVDWFSADDPRPLHVTEIEFVDGTEFEAALSTAPVVQSEGPAELSPPAKSEDAPEDVAQPEDATASSAAPVLSSAEPPEPKPERPEIAIPKPPTDIPTEDPVPTIAEIPSPDPLNRQSTEPESPPSTEPVQPLATAPPQPFDKPTAPPEPESEPEQEPETAEIRDPDQTAEQEATAEPEPEQEPDPESFAEAQQEAPQGLAPQIAKLPVARPAELAAAAQAAREQEQAAEQAESEKQEQQASDQAQSKPKPQQTATNTGGSSARNAPRLNRGEKNALRLGIKKFYTFSGDRSDKTLAVVVRIDLDPSGQIVGKPAMQKAEGGSAASQRALFNAGRRAVLRAAAAGEFTRLPADKYPRWKRINIVFTVDKVGLSS